MRGFLALSLLVLSAEVTLSGSGSECRNCDVGGCVSVQRADGGCPGCICNGLLMSDCPQLNCTSTCEVRPTSDGCSECFCIDSDQEICDPIPPCPSRCQIQLGGGCPRCTCPEELGPQCPKVSCPSACNKITKEDGCPGCECPPEDKVCPEMPACPLGCIDTLADPALSGCLDCNCTLLDDLASENQILPEPENQVLPEPVTPPGFNMEAELVTDPIDDGLLTTMEGPNPPTGVPADTNTPMVPGTDNPAMPNNEMPMGSDPNMDRNTPQQNGIPVTPENGSPGTPLASFRPSGQPDPSSSGPMNNFPGVPVAPRIGPGPSSNTPVDPQVGPRPSSNAPVDPRVGQTQPGPSPNVPVAPRVGNRPNVNALSGTPNRRRPHIPCGETSCPRGCVLCIQRNSCGRCLCGNSARVCPAVPACAPSCIMSGRDGCFTCSCPNPQGSFRRNPGGFPPQSFFPGAPPGQIFPIRGSPNGGQSPFHPVIRVNLARPQRPQSQSPGRLAIQSIPPELLGVSRFHVSG